MCGPAGDPPAAGGADAEMPVQDTPAGNGAAPRRRRPAQATPRAGGHQASASQRPANYAPAPMVIAIDGPAGAGKSTVARALAERLGATYLDSGAMYRSVALLTLREGADPDDAAAVEPLVEGLEIGMDGRRITLAGEDVSAAIRTPEVSAAASRVSVHRGVRAAMVARQRELLQSGAWVAEGRDIGTVVFPEAPLKVFLTASDEERARRRAAESGSHHAEVLAAQRDRDARDREREYGALVAAADAVEVDTTGLGLEAVVERITEIAAERGLA